MCVCVCVHVFVTPLQPNRLEAITGRQGCYGDQWSQRWATSVRCFSRQGFLIVGLSPVISSAWMINLDFLFTLFPNVSKHGTWTDFEKDLFPLLTVQLPVLSCSHLFLSQSAGTRGLCPWKAGEEFNPCLVTTPSLHGFPLYKDMFCFSSSFLLAALSVAQQGTRSLFIGTYLGKGRNPMFLSDP